MNSVNRLFYLLVAVTFASAIIFAPDRVSAGPGECPAYNAAEIDSCFVEWADVASFDFTTPNIECFDDPSGPNTSIFLLGAGEAEFELFVSEITNRARIEGDTDIRLSPFPCPTSADGLSIPELHICRAEILRSITWRQLCAKKVDRSPDN